jgi:hypothetical protein
VQPNRESRSGNLNHIGLRSFGHKALQSKLVSGLPNPARQKSAVFERQTERQEYGQSSARAHRVLMGYALFAFAARFGLR